MYTHEVVHSGPLTALVHYREAKSPSGLFTSTEIGHTFALQERLPRMASGLLVATEFDVAHIEQSRQNPSADPKKVTERIDCESLDEFVGGDIGKWQELLGSLGYIARSGVKFVERVEIVDEVRPSGLIIPTENPEFRFDGYLADADELDAMERIAAAIYIPDESHENTGNYL